MAKLTFLGAAQQVTGSCYLIQTGSHTILLECGLRQGEDKGHNGYTLPELITSDHLAPGDIDVVVISHAHLDHSGLVPLLVKQGYSGKIICSSATADLLPIMYMDAASLQKSDIERKNRRLLRAGKQPLQPAYEYRDVENTLKLVEGINYNTSTRLFDDITVCFHDAGHILGSAIVELKLNIQGQEKTLVFSGDLGNCCAPLMNDPSTLDHADILMMESTYGNRNHRPLDKTLEEFKSIISDAANQGGNILIPAFAVGRTQDLIYWLGLLYHEGLLNNRRVYIDSPMAIKVSDVYDRHQNLFNDDDPRFREFMKQGWDKWLPPLTYTESAEESMQINRISDGAIIIAGSGMCTGGRILHHFKYNLWRSKNHVVIVGYQARGTLGRALVDGASSVKIFGEDIAVKARIHTLGGLSAHAGQDQLIEWAGHFDTTTTRLHLVHGEIDAMQALQQRFVDEHQWDAYIPTLNEVIRI